MTETSPLTSAVYGSFGPGDDGALGAALSAFLDDQAAPPALLAFGEPAHLEPAFARMRNRMLRPLAERGFRSIAIESDRIAALRVDAYVRGGHGTLDDAMAGGFSHGWGAWDVNRELVAWLRAYNRDLPPAERLAFHGMDAPMETMSAPSPRRHLRHLHDYLTAHLGPDAFLHGRAGLDRLLGDDERWSATEAVLDPARSPGATADARALRAIADDLLTVLYVHAPALVAASSPDAWHDAQTYGRAALGLLRYHAQAAEPLPPAERWSRMCAVRDALMAENLLAIRARERHRGPTLVFANNLHLQRNPSAMDMGDMHLEWLGAGAITATLLDEPYAFIAGTLGASPALGLGAAPPGTYEHALQRAATGDTLFDARRLHASLPATAARADVTPAQGYFPLDPETIGHADAVLHIPDPPAPTAETGDGDR